MERSERAGLIGGSEPREVVLVRHDAAWASLFADLRQALMRELAGIAVRIEHVGSTAVAGLDAKPIIDIQVGVPDVDDEPRLTPRMQTLGYELRVREPSEHLMYRNAARDVHVHMWIASSEDKHTAPRVLRLAAPLTSGSRALRSDETRFGAARVAGPERLRLRQRRRDRADHGASGGLGGRIRLGVPGAAAACSIHHASRCGGANAHTAVPGLRTSDASRRARGRASRP